MGCPDRSFYRSGSGRGRLRLGEVDCRRSVEIDLAELNLVERDPAELGLTLAYVHLKQHALAPSGRTPHHAAIGLDRQIAVLDLFDLLAWRQRLVGGALAMRHVGDDQSWLIVHARCERGDLAPILRGLVGDGDSRSHHAMIDLADCCWSFYVLV